MIQTLFIIDPEGYLLNTVDLWIGEHQLPPAGHIAKKPPKAKKNQVARWDGENWKLVADFRGTKYWPKDANFGDKPIEITQIGIKPPKGALFEEPTETLERKVAMLRSDVMTFYITIKDLFVPSSLGDVYALKAQAAADVIAVGTRKPPEGALALLSAEAAIRKVKVPALSRMILSKAMEAKTAMGTFEAARIWASDLLDGIKNETDFSEVAKILAAKKVELCRQFEIKSA